MNSSAHTAFANAISGFIREQPLELRRRLIVAMDLYDNECAGSRDIAMDAIHSGRDVFWRSSGYSSQKVANMVDQLNRGDPFVMAWHSNWHPFQDAARDQALDYIVPISHGAAVVLANAYNTLGTWRDDAELELRRTRREVRRAV